MSKRRYYVYRYYIGDELLYVGQTIDPLGRFRQHCSDEDVYRDVTKIELTELNSRIDMDMCEIYYINLLKPPHNRKDANRGEPSFIIQNEPIFKTYTVEEFVNAHAKTTKRKVSTVKKNNKLFDTWMDGLPEVDEMSHHVISDMYFKGEFIFQYKGFAVNIAPFSLKGNDVKKLPRGVFNKAVKGVLSTTYWGHYFNSLFSAMNSKNCLDSNIYKHYLDMKYAKLVFEGGRGYLEDSLTKIKLTPDRMPVITFERYRSVECEHLIRSISYSKKEEVLELELNQDMMRSVNF